MKAVLKALHYCRHCNQVSYLRKRSESPNEEEWEELRDEHDCPVCKCCDTMREIPQ